MNADIACAVFPARLGKRSEEFPLVRRIRAADSKGIPVAGNWEKKILRNVFETGDAWFRTGDLMRQDENGFYYFIDRIGDTFRWKGENVSTTEVSEAITAFPGVAEANVYGVENSWNGWPGRHGCGCRRQANSSLPDFTATSFPDCRLTLVLCCCVSCVKWESP